jgi:group I intron endonuclease
VLFRDAPTTGGIYLITNTVDGKRYVGQSANIRGRWYTHRWALQRNRSGSRRLQNAWNRHGEASFEFTVLCLVPDVGALDAWEQWYFDALAPEYNISRRPGTRRGVPQPLDAVARTAAQMRGASEVGGMETPG